MVKQSFLVFCLLRHLYQTNGIDSKKKKSRPSLFTSSFPHVGDKFCIQLLTVMSTDKRDNEVLFFFHFEINLQSVVCLNRF